MQNVLEILLWYKKNFRELPWRETSDPYRIWLSEVILQQTRVAQGQSYYEAFISEYPDVKALAAADEQQVLRLWQGLGYYSRARNMHRTARIINERYQGIFPEDHQALLSLPGIGAYTAAAIMSFAFGKPYPVLDGNVYRVLARYYGISSPVNDPRSAPVFMEILTGLIQGQPPALFNNALMEFGATLCTPRSPSCGNCPLRGSCFAYRHDMTGTLPVRKPAQTKKTRYFHFFVLGDGDTLYLEKRGGNDIWKHLFQFPLIETDRQLNESEIEMELSSKLLKNKVLEIRPLEMYRHILTHQEIHAGFSVVKTAGEPVLLREGAFSVSRQDLNKYPVPALIEKFLLSL